MTAKLHATNSSAILSPSAKRIDIPASNSTGMRAKYYSPLTPSPSPSNLVLQEGTIASALTRGSGAFGPTPPNTPPTSNPHPFASAESQPELKSALLAKLFPNSADDAARLAKTVSVQSFQPDGSCVLWDGFVLKTPPPVAPPRRSSSASPTSPTRSAFKGARAAQAENAAAAAAGKTTRTLYMSAQSAFSQTDRMRETIVALLDLASEHLECDAVVMVLDRSVIGEGNERGNGSRNNAAANANGSGLNSKQEFEELLHSLMYVGGSVVTRPPFPVDPRLVLVGIEV